MVRPDAVAVTGGTGRIGPALLDRLRARGYRTVNLSRGGSAGAADAGIRADVTDPGDVYGALATADVDAVVHLAAIPRPTNDPGHVVFESSVTGTYHVLEAAAALGAERVCLASSLSALGAGFEPDPVRVEYLPVDEFHPLSPSNPYGLGKQVAEVTADGVARRPGAPQIASIRFPWVTTDEDLRETFVEADRTLDGLRESGFLHEARNTLFAYLHREDAAELVCRTLETDFGGHERFWAAAADTNVELPTADLVAAVFPDAEVRGSFEGNESLLNTAKARRTLGWEPTRSWREFG